VAAQALFSLIAERSSSLRLGCGIEAKFFFFVLCIHHLFAAQRRRDI
jgi:hypothetical protein